ncbi:MAG TPA: prolyl oligopeptidase family serine peptidase [Jatrophihabitans sp.]|jgi:prolyl oligopeptidase
MSFPDTRTVEQVDEYHGVAVADPYRWLEDQSSDEVMAWMRAQADLAADYLAGLPGRDRFAGRLTELWSLPSSTAPELRGNRWFRMANDGRQQQPVLRVSDEALGEGQVLIDPNLAAADGSTALAGAVPDPTGQLVAWSYNEGGSDWRRWRVRDVETGQDLDDEINWSKFVEPAWLGDSSGFVYAHYQPTDSEDVYSAPAGVPELKLHRIGTSQDSDELVMTLPEQSSTHLWPWIDDGGRWLVVLADNAAEDSFALWVRDLSNPDDELHEVIGPSRNEWVFVAADSDELILRTTRDAGRGALVRLDPATGVLTPLIDERTDLLQSAARAQDRLIVSWLSDACSRITVHSLDGTEIAAPELPGIGSVEEITASPSSPVAHLSVSTFASSPQIYSYDVLTAELNLGYETPLPGADVSIDTDQIWVTSADGTRLPCFVVHRADVTAENGPHPTLLYGYGGFDVSLTPTFEPQIRTFAEAGGVWVVANLRGGGEYGSQWHDAGKLANKQNVFDDAIAAAEHLITSGWTSSAKLAVHGRSNGGLLVGAVLTQRPDLFAAALPQVGVLDMLRYQLFTIGAAWAADYGLATRSKDEFETLYAYSPYHRIAEGAGYPPTLILTSAHDDRVVPAHSLKFAARLQSVSQDGAIAHLRVDFGAGHGLGRSRSTLIQERTDQLTFIAAHTGLETTGDPLGH